MSDPAVGPAVPARLVFLDTETTGLDDARHEMWEVGFIVRRDGHRDAEHAFRVAPDLTRADPAALRVGRFYERTAGMLPGDAAADGTADPDGHLAADPDGYPAGHLCNLAAGVCERTARTERHPDRPRAPEPSTSAGRRPGHFSEPRLLALRLARALDGAHVVGAVPDFDHRFLRAFLRRHGQCWTAHHHLIDVEALAVGYLHGRASTWPLWPSGVAYPAGGSAVAGPAPPWTSTTLSRLVGVDPDGFDRHTALGDARWARALYDAVTGGRHDRQ